MKIAVLRIITSVVRQATEKKKLWTVKRKQKNANVIKIFPTAEYKDINSFLI